MMGHLGAVIVNIYHCCSLSRTPVRDLRLTAPCLGLDSLGYLVPTNMFLVPTAIGSSFFDMVDVNVSHRVC
jgi:hypothetical protein